MQPITKEDAIQAAEELPPFPTTALEVIHRLEDPEVNVSDIAALITVDEVLASKLLRWANSPLWGVSRKIMSVQKAVMTLGFITVKSLIYTVCLEPLLNKPIGGYKAGRLLMWKHALMSAILSRGLGQHLRILDCEALYMAGLLHDVGILVLSTFARYDPTQLRRRLQEEKLMLIQVEEELYGMNHAEVGSAVLEHWNIPLHIVELVRYHHEPASSESKEAYIVHLADYISVQSGLGLGINIDHYPFTEDTLEQLNLQQDKIETITAEASAIFKDTFSFAIGA